MVVDKNFKMAHLHLSISDLTLSHLVSLLLSSIVVSELTIFLAVLTMCFSFY